MDQHFWDKWPIIFYSIRHYGAVLPQTSKSNCNDFLQLNSSNQKRSNHHFVEFQLHLFSYTHLNIITGLQTHQAGSQIRSHTLFWLAKRQLFGNQWKDRTGIQSLVPTNIVRPNEKELMSLRAYLLLFLKQLMQPSQLGTGIQISCFIMIIRIHTF